MELGEFAAAMMHAAAHIPLAMAHGLEKGCRIIEKEAKAAIGTYKYGWPALGPAAVDKHGDTPLLDTGEMRDSITHNCDHHEGYVGSDDNKLLWQEFGTSRGIPPRPVMGGAVEAKGHEAAEAIGGHVFAEVFKR